MAWFGGVPPFAVVAAAVSVVIIVAAAIGTDRWVAAGEVADSSTADPNPNCTLVVPANPLTAQGLATPYQLTATDPGNGPCNEANPDQTAFVQGAVFDPAAGTISVYNPLVIDAGTQPAKPPVVPTLPKGAVVAVWFGYNGDVLSLAGADQQAAQPGTGAGAQQGTGAAATSAAGHVNAVQARVIGASASPTTSASSSASASPTTSASSIASASPSASATGPASPSSPATSASPSATAAPSTTPAPSSSASPSSSSGSPATPDPANGPAASATPDAILQQSDCVAGQHIDGQFSPFSQVGACNAAAFFRAANAAVESGKLPVPNPGTGKDGLPCLTTRSFALIDQDQSDNVTAQYLATASGQTAQDTSANEQALGQGAMTLFNGSDNGLLDFFVDPALGCSPWTVPDLANDGAKATALPLDEIQAAQWAPRQKANGPAALVPLNDPMTVDDNGSASSDKTNTYRSIMDMAALPAGQSPTAYCADMEQLQVKRLQQDVNLLIGAPSPALDTGNNLFTFLASRLQGSFDNLNCASFGLQDDVSTTADANGVAVAACFAHQAAPVTPGPGNPTAGKTTCPPTATGSPDPGTSPASPTATPSSSPSSQTSPATPSPSPSSGTSMPPASATGTPQPTGDPATSPGGAPASASPSGSDGTLPTGGPSTGAPSGDPSMVAPPVTASMPSATAPSATAPSTPTSPTTAPSATAPSATAPSATAPSATAPSTTAPSTTGAATTEPATAAPTTVASPVRGWHDGGRTYSGWPSNGRRVAWPGLGPHWAKPNPRRAIFASFWSGLLTVLLPVLRRPAGKRPAAVEQCARDPRLREGRFIHDREAPAGPRRQPAGSAPGSRPGDRRRRAGWL